MAYVLMWQLVYLEEAPQLARLSTNGCLLPCSIEYEDAPFSRRQVQISIDVKVMFGLLYLA